jgi:type I restriction enzyme S subunit
MKRWPTKPLGDVAEFINGRAFKPSDWSSRGVPIIRIQNLTDPTAAANRFSGAFDQRNAVKDGDLLVSWSATLDVFVWDRGEAVLNQHIFRVIPDSSQVLKAYLFFALKSVMDELRSKTHGATMKHITKGPFERTLIPVPPLAEQERLVQLLDQADELQKLRAQSNHRTTALIPSLFHEMFGDPISNPKGCKVVRLEEVTTRITDGVHLKPNYTTSGVPFISVKNITTGQLKFDDCKFISAEDHGKFTKRCKPEYLDILYTKVGATYGRPALVDTKMEFSIYVSVCLIKPVKSVIDPHFLEVAMGTPAIKSQADRSIKGIGVPDLHLDQIQKFLLPLPPLAQQKEFAARVSEIRAVQAEQATSHRRLDNLFQSLLHRAFNGDLLAP